MSSGTPCSWAKKENLVNSKIIHRLIEVNISSHSEVRRKYRVLWGFIWAKLRGVKRDICHHTFAISLTRWWYPCSLLAAILRVAKSPIAVEYRAIASAPAQVSWIWWLIKTQFGFYTYKITHIFFKKGVTLLPWKASCKSCSVGRGLFRRRVYMDITKPGVQKPHWVPWLLAILSCTGCRPLCTLPRPSTVTTAFPWMVHTGVKHAFIAEFLFSSYRS